DQYDGEIAYTDEHLGRLLAEADALGLLANTMVILTSDHGEGLTERHGGKAVFFDHGQHVWEELARVPLVVYRPGEPAGRSDALDGATGPLVAELARYLARDTQDLDALKWDAESARMKARAPHDARVKGDLERLRPLGYVQ